MNYGIIVAAGRGERMEAKVDKAFLSLGPRPVLAYALMAYEKCPDIDGMVLVIRKERLGAGKAVADMFGCSKLTAVVAGGPTRQASVMNGLDALPPDAKLVSIHDGARPLVSPDLITETLKVAKRQGSGVAATRMTDTVKYVERGLTVTHTLDRNKVWAVQTPQAFRLDVLLPALKAASALRRPFTDEAGALEAAGGKIRLVPSTSLNMKITTPRDVALVTAWLDLHWDA